MDLGLGAETIEVINEISGHEDLNGFIDITDGDALLNYLVAVHVNELLRHTREKCGGGEPNLRTLAKCGQKCAQITGKELNILSRPILKHEGKAAGRTDPGNGWRCEAESDSLRPLTQFLIYH